MDEVRGSIPLDSTKFEIALANPRARIYAYRVEEKLAAYEETRARVAARLVELRAEQKRMNWLALPGIIAIVVARYFGFIPMLLTATIAISIFCVSHYVVYMHIDDSKLTLKQLRKSIAQMKDQRAG